MSNQLTTTLLAMDYLKANPDMQRYGGKSLAQIVDDPKCSFSTWKKARKLMNLPPVPRFGMTYAKTRQQERKAAFAIYPNTHKIVVDTQRMKIVFHGEGGFKTAEKTSRRHRGCQRSRWRGGVSMEALYIEAPEKWCNKCKDYWPADFFPNGHSPCRACIDEKRQETNAAKLCSVPGCKNPRDKWRYSRCKEHRK